MPCPQMVPNLVLVVELRHRHLEALVPARILLLLHLPPLLRLHCHRRSVLRLQSA